MEEPLLTSVLETTQEHYKQNHWAWIENIFPNNFYTELVAHWPKRRYFNPPYLVTKSYDVGFKWNRGDSFPEYLEYFPELGAFLTYLRSDAFAKRIVRYIHTDKQVTCNSFLVNMTYPGSCVIPHKDDPLPDYESPFINMIFFVDGTGGGNSGELILSHDSNQDEIFFTPPILQNACLLYDTEGDFFHGFPPVARGKSRWVITASFSPEYTTS